MMIRMLIGQYLNRLKCIEQAVCKIVSNKAHVFVSNLLPVAGSPPNRTNDNMIEPFNLIMEHTLLPILREESNCKFTFVDTYSHIDQYQDLSDG